MRMAGRGLAGAGATGAASARRARNGREPMPRSTATRCDPAGGSPRHGAPYGVARDRRRDRRLARVRARRRRGVPPGMVGRPVSSSDRSLGIDPRGNNRDRARRRLWLLATFGDGERCPCFHCGAELTYATLETDRYPICGHDGGRYTRDNIVPACKRCNGGRCSRCDHDRSSHRPAWWSTRGRRGIGIRAGRRVAARRR